MVSQKEQGQQLVMEKCARWVENYFDCEVYFLHHDDTTNGFVEYRNDRHIIYILGNQEKMDMDLFLDILAHEAGHVVYNKRVMARGISYKEIVRRTTAKLHCFTELLEKNVITDDECDRLYAAIEEEWESNREKEKIVDDLKNLLQIK